MSQESIVLHLKDKILVLKSEGFDEEVDIDQLTKIDYSNLYGEQVTSAVLLNKVGILRAEAENIYEHKKIEFSIFESELARSKRQDAAANDKKLTEKALEQAIILDPAWRIQKRNLINSKRDLDFVESLYWSVQSKDRKLNAMMKGITPEEFENEIIEGVINTVLIKKHKKKFGE
jgi:hypothetical protein